MKNAYGITLIEMLITIVIMAGITLGLLFFLRTGMNYTALLQERAGIYQESGRIMDTIRADLSTITAVTDMEYYNNLNSDVYFNSLRLPGTGTVEREDMIIPADDPSTFSLREDFYPPQDNASTPFQESLLNYENLPFGITYDYVFGITNSGNADAIYFRGSVKDGDKRVPANICYRLFKKRISPVDEDTGVDGKADEDEDGFHPVANPDPAYDNFDPVLNAIAAEGNDRFDLDPDGTGPGLPETDRDGNGLIDRAYTFELQRIVTTIEDEEGDFGADGIMNSQEPGYDPVTNPDPNGDNFDALTNPKGTEGNGQIDKIPVTRTEVLSRLVTAFNILYYDRGTGQYREPASTIRRFSYPPDVGLVGRFNTDTPPWLSLQGMSTEIFPEEGGVTYSTVSAGDSIFLRSREIVFDVYQISNVDTALKRIRFNGIPPVGVDAAVQFIPAGIFDTDGMLSCPAVKDGFMNLAIGDQVFVQQWNAGATDFAVKPGLYTVIDKRGGKLLLDLKGQEPVFGTSTVFFRSAFFPPGIRVELRWWADQISQNRGEPSYVSLSQTIVLP
ncbi:MAG: hypothetical protein E3K32_05245 [wastewater metagenome]|nr:hypothetical protein [Candidatus Loosdrechtia aerotolerans]